MNRGPLDAPKRQRDLWGAKWIKHICVFQKRRKKWTPYEGGYRTGNGCPGLHLIGWREIIRGEDPFWAMMAESRAASTKSRWAISECIKQKMLLSLIKNFPVTREAWIETRMLRNGGSPHPRQGGLNHYYWESGPPPLMERLRTHPLSESSRLTQVRPLEEETSPVTEVSKPATAVTVGGGGVAKISTL